jgi:hypothetical protein
LIIGKLPTNHADFTNFQTEPMDMDEEEGGHGVADEDEPLDAATSIAEQDTDASFDSTPDTSIDSVILSANLRRLHGKSVSADHCARNNYDFEIKATGEVAQLDSDLTSITNIPSDAAVDTYMTNDRQDLSVPAEVTCESLSVQQESTLVRSALRSSLGGEDAELLNNFLSKAKAARAARAAAMTVQDAAAEQACQEVSDVPTPQARRALEELDANSPSPSKVQLSPAKASDPADEPDRDQARKHVDAEEDDQAASPVRRSSRNRAAKGPPQTTPSLRTLTLRRAKGTEFVFLQRTEAQELALATRRNTRHNKGNAVMPKYMLQALAEKSQKTNLDIDDGNARDPSRTRTGAKKYVSWNEERLVQYQGENNSEGERKRNDVADAGVKVTVKATDKAKSTSGRSLRSQTAVKTGGDEVAASTTAPSTAAPAPKARRVRRLGGSKSNSSPVTATSTKRASLLPTPSTSNGVEKRKKLIPKAPSLVATGTPVSKKMLPRATSEDRSSSDSTSGSASQIKSKNILKAHAGSTPMPKRIRPRP